MTSRVAFTSQKQREELLRSVAKAPEVLVPLLLREPDGKPVQLTGYQGVIVRAVLSRVHPDDGSHLGSVLVKMPTGAGKTKALGCSYALNSLIRPEVALNIAPVEKQALQCFSDVRGYYANSPIFATLRDDARPFTTSEGYLKTGGGVICKTANLQNRGDTLLSHHYPVVGCDERALIPDDVYRQKIDRMVKPTGGRAFHVDVSTTQKSRPPFALMKQMDESGMYDLVVKITWRDVVRAGRMTIEDVEKRRALLTVQEFRTWYETEYAEDEEGTLIASDLIERAARIGVELGISA